MNFELMRQQTLEGGSFCRATSLACFKEVGQVHLYSQEEYGKGSTEGISSQY